MQPDSAFQAAQATQATQGIQGTQAVQATQGAPALFPCPICSKKFKSKYYIPKHIKTAHGEENTGNDTVYKNL